MSLPVQLPARAKRKFNGKWSFPIPVWNGLLEHRQRIGVAVWEFLWCLDRITSEKDGVGLVLGGAPVKAAEIAADLREDEKTVRRNLNRLEERGYIERRRTPYGFAIQVMNSLKFGIWRSGKSVQENGQKCPRDRTEVSVTKKTQQETQQKEPSRDKRGLARSNHLPSEEEITDLLLPELRVAFPADAEPLGREEVLRGVRLARLLAKEPPRSVSYFRKSVAPTIYDFDNKLERWLSQQAEELLFERDRTKAALTKALKKLGAEEGFNPPDELIEKAIERTGYYVAEERAAGVGG